VANDTDRLAALERRQEMLEHKIGLLEDAHAVKCLQFKYGYYLDKCLYDEVVDLFSDSGAVHFMGGRYNGKAGARRLYCNRFRHNFTDDHNGPIYGFLLDHPQFQDIVDVAPDGNTAKGRFRVLMQAGSHLSKTDRKPFLPQQWWEAGIYENDYVKEDGVWRIKLLNYNLFWQANFETGWAHHKPYAGHESHVPKTYPEDPNGPDEIVGGALPFWPETPVVPFHYPHPVTGKWWNEAD
jgi:hypothetical protein